MRASLVAARRRVVRKAYAIGGRLPASVKRRLIRAVSARFMVGLIAIVTDGEGRVLVLEHTYRPQFPYGVPTGVLRKGEQVGAAIVREIREETSLDVRFRRVLAVRAEDRPRRMDVWLACDLVGGTFAASAEVRSAAFLTLAEAEVVLLASQLELVRQHLARSESAGA